MKTREEIEKDFENIYKPLSFEKSVGDDLEKGDMQYALGDIKFKKKGSDLKKMIETKKSILMSKKVELKTALDLIVSEYQEKGGVVIYDENLIPQLKESGPMCCDTVVDYSLAQQKRIPTPDGFWDKSYQLRSLCDDIKTLETLQSNLEDNKEYEMTTRQLTCLQ